MGEIVIYSPIEENKALANELGVVAPRVSISSELTAKLIPPPVAADHASLVLDENNALAGAIQLNLDAPANIDLKLANKDTSAKLKPDFNDYSLAQLSSSGKADLNISVTAAYIHKNKYNLQAYNRAIWLGAALTKAYSEGSIRTQESLLKRNAIRAASVFPVWAVPACLFIPHEGTLEVVGALGVTASMLANAGLVVAGIDPTKYFAKKHKKEIQELARSYPVLRYE